jgi:prophage regulatory protein
MNHQQQQQPETLVRFPEVIRRTGLSRPWIYELMKAGTFPKQVKLGKRAVAWRESDLAKWIGGRK